MSPVVIQIYWPSRIIGHKGMLAIIDRRIHFGEHLFYGFTAVAICDSDLDDWVGCPVSSEANLIGQSRRPTNDSLGIDGHSRLLNKKLVGQVIVIGVDSIEGIAPSCAYHCIKWNGSDQGRLILLRDRQRKFLACSVLGLYVVGHPNLYLVVTGQGGWYPLDFGFAGSARTDLHAGRWIDQLVTHWIVVRVHCRDFVPPHRPNDGWPRG